MLLSRLLIRPSWILILWSGYSLIGGIVADEGFAAEPQLSTPEAVDNMHHFMEYVFEPNYKRLRTGLAAAPSEKADWKAIKGDSLTLAEAANLLLMRLPKENSAVWISRATAVRHQGGLLFEAARKSDYQAARRAYLRMLNNCNACHKSFADGKYQLEP